MIRKKSIIQTVKNFSTYLDEGDGGGIDHDSHVEQHLDTEQGRGEHSDTRVKSEAEGIDNMTNKTFALHDCIIGFIASVI